MYFVCGGGAMSPPHMPKKPVACFNGNSCIQGCRDVYDYLRKSEKIEKLATKTSEFSMHTLFSAVLSRKFFFTPHGLFGRSARGPSAPASYGTAGGAAAAQRAGRQLGTGGHASCRTSCRGGACAPGIGAWTGGDPSKVAASVFCTTTLSRPHQRLYQPWVAAPRSGAGARMVRERTSCATRRSDSSFQRPPISHASTHSRCGPRRRSSGQAARLRRSAMARAAPSLVVEEDCGRPSRVSGETRVTSQHSASPSCVAPCGTICDEVETPAIVRIDTWGRRPNEPLLQNDLALWPDCFAHHARSSGLARRARRPVLLHIICGPLFFSWKGHDGWQQPQHQGVQHGHFYSAILFASSLGSWGWLAVRRRLAPAPRQLVSSDCSPATAAVCPSPCGTKAFGSSHFGSSTFHRSRSVSYCRA